MSYISLEKPTMASQTENNVFATQEPSGLSWMSLMIPLEELSLVRYQCISVDREGNSNVQHYLSLFSLAPFRHHWRSEFHLPNEIPLEINHNHSHGFVIRRNSWMFHHCLLDVWESEVICCADHFEVVEVCLGEYSHRVIQSLLFWSFERTWVLFWQWNPGSICIYECVVLPVFLV